jgi:hypothetical protein
MFLSIPGSSVRPARPLSGTNQAPAPRLHHHQQQQPRPRDGLTGFNRNSEASDWRSPREGSHDDFSSYQSQPHHHQQQQQPHGFDRWSSEMRSGELLGISAVYVDVSLLCTVLPTVFMFFLMKKPRITWYTS